MVVGWKSRRTLRVQQADILFIAYITWTCIRGGTAVDVSRLEDAALLFLYVIIRCTGNKYILWWKMFLIYGSIGLSGYGYLQYFNLLPRLNDAYSIVGAFSSPAVCGGLLCFLIVALVSVALYESKPTTKGLMLKAICFSLPALILSASRTAWIACFIPISILLYSRYKGRIQHVIGKINHKRLSIAALVVLVLTCLYSLYQIRPDSIKGRFFIWEVSMGMVADAPIIGLGYNGVEAHYMNYQGNYFKQSKGDEEDKYLAGNVVSVYNEPLRILVEYGIIGLLLYLTLVYSVLFHSVRLDITAQSSRAVLIAYLLFGLFSFPNRVFLLQLIGIVALASLINEEMHRGWECHLGRLQWGAFRIVGGLFMLLLIGEGVLFFRSYRIFHSVLSGRPSNALEQVKKLDGILSGDIWFVMDSYGMTKGVANKEYLMGKLNRAIQLSPSSTLYVLKGDFCESIGLLLEAEQSYLTAHYMVPYQWLPSIRLAKLYLMEGRTVEARRLAASLLQKPTKSHGVDVFVLRQEIEDIARGAIPAH